MEDKKNNVSINIIENFEIAENSLEMIHFHELYCNLARIIPHRNYSFDSIDLETAIACEVICAAICHQINWDFLRKVVLDQTICNPTWILPESIQQISAKDVYKLLVAYDKPERIRAEERAKMLRSLGKMLSKLKCHYSEMFIDRTGNLRDKKFIFSVLNSMSAFSGDPEEKKIQLLLQNLSDYPELSSLANYFKPAIDYHIMRLYLRRGLIIPQNQEAIAYLFSPEKQRKEKTVAAIRNLCSKVFKLINWLTKIDIKTINSIEWWIGRSVCKKKLADCNLSTPETEWLHLYYNKCPFCESCYAYKYNNKYLTLTEPRYNGSSY